MTTIFILADNTCSARVITDPDEIPKIIKDFTKHMHFWTGSLSELNKPGGCIRLVCASPESNYHSGPTVLSITRADI